MSFLSSQQIGVVLLIYILVGIEGRSPLPQEHFDLNQHSAVPNEVHSRVLSRPREALTMLLYSVCPASLVRDPRLDIHRSTKSRLLAASHLLRKDARIMHDRSSLMMVNASDQQEEQSRNSELKVFPCGDALDKELCRLSFFAMINFLILPLTGAIDLFFVGKLGNPLAVAGQAAADRIYNTAALLNVVPVVTQPRVAKANATGDQDAVQREVGTGVFLSVIVGTCLSLITGLGSKTWLLAVGSKAALPFSLPYFLYRLPGQIPAVLATVSFVTLQALRDLKTPFKISVVSCIVNAVLNYVLMFPVGLGIAGAAIATSVSQIIASIAYLGVLSRRKLLRWSQALRPPSREMLSTLTAAIGVLQVRNVASNMALLAVTKTSQTLDSTGIAASAHAAATTFWQLGGVVLFSLSAVGQILVARELGKKDSTPEAARAVARRLFAWGALMGTLVGILQILGLPLLKLFSAVPEVQEAARAPMTIGAMLQPINSLAFVGEGLMTAAGAFSQQALGMVIASALFLVSLKFSPPTLVGVWLSFWVWMSIRLANVAYFFWFAKSPLKPEKSAA